MLACCGLFRGNCCLCGLSLFPDCSGQAKPDPLLAWYELAWLLSPVGNSWCMSGPN